MRKCHAGGMKIAPLPPRQAFDDPEAVHIDKGHWQFLLQHGPTTSDILALWLAGIVAAWTRGRSSFLPELPTSVQRAHRPLTHVDLPAIWPFAGLGRASEPRMFRKAGITSTRQED